MLYTNMSNAVMFCAVVMIVVTLLMVPENEGSKKVTETPAKRQLVVNPPTQNIDRMSYGQDVYHMPEPSVNIPMRQRQSFNKGEQRPHGKSEEPNIKFNNGLHFTKRRKQKSKTVADVVNNNSKHLFNKIEDQVDKSSSRPVTTVGTLTGSKRVAPALAAAASNIMGNEKIQEAVVDKGIEVVGGLIDKQLANIEGAQNKSNAFLNKKIKLDIFPGKGWQNEDMFVPPGYHFGAEMEADSSPSSSDERGIMAYTFPSGIGNVMMNGCWGTGYERGDPCYNALGTATACENMIDGAAFIGVGFDGRGEYSPESRKMSIIQRFCAGRSFYDDFQVPDAMHVHGIFETNANMRIFSSRSEYQTYLQTEAGVSGSYFGFYAGVKAAYGFSSSGSEQTNLAVFEIDIDRYEIFKDEVKPEDLSRSFLREFMNLPTTYFEPGAPAKFQDFIMRWGTHYIKSAKFGGQLQLQKLQQGSMTASKSEFAVESEAEFRSLFASAGAKHSTEGGNSSKSEQKFMSTSVVALGGSHRIAAIVTDLYSPTFKGTFLEWLDSIPSYPKAFKFHMGSITDLVDFRAHDLFPEETVDWGCEGHSQNLTQDETTDTSFYMATVGEKKKKVNCEFGSRDELEHQMKSKRVSLKTAIQVYMEEDVLSITDVNLPAGDGGCESDSSEYQSAVTKPTWDEIATNGKQFRVVFDMDVDLKGFAGNIPKSMSRLMKFSQANWYTSNEDGKFHLFNGFSNGGTGNIVQHRKISIFGLILTYNKLQGTLTLNTADFASSRLLFPHLSENLKNRPIARVQWPSEMSFLTLAKNSIGHSPCNVKWSNTFRFDPSERPGKCLHFTVFSKGTVYVVFSSIPSEKRTWYYVEASQFGVIIYKAGVVKALTHNTDSVALGDILLYQSYFVCVSTTATSTVISYGKTKGSPEFGDVYLTMIDNDDPIHVGFYTFGNGEEPMEVIDAHIVSRSMTSVRCRGSSITAADGENCVMLQCHETCDSSAGCRHPTGAAPLPSECNKCKYAKSGENCVMSCPAGQTANREGECYATYDLAFRAGRQISYSSVTVPSTVEQFTICIWIRFPVHNSGTDRFKEFSILKYDIGEPDNLFRLVVSYNRVGAAVLIIRYFLDNVDVSIERRAEEKAITTATWHSVCITRQCETGETNLFWDGIKSNFNSASRSISPGKTLKQGGTITLSGDSGGADRNPHDLFWTAKATQLNIWDYILSNEQIAKVATDGTCRGGSGNLIDWTDVKNGPTRGQLNLIYMSPSTCKSANHM